MLYKQHVFPPQHLSLKLSATNFLMVALPWAILPWACHFHNSNIALTNENFDIMEANIHFLGLLLSDFSSVFGKSFTMTQKTSFLQAHTILAYLHMYFLSVSFVTVIRKARLTKEILRK